jgi:hypothetical protein
MCAVTPLRARLWSEVADKVLCCRDDRCAVCADRHLRALIHGQTRVVCRRWAVISLLIPMAACVCVCVSVSQSVCRSVCVGVHVDVGVGVGAWVTAVGALRPALREDHHLHELPREYQKCHK